MNKTKVNKDGTLNVALGTIWCLFSIYNEYNQPNDNLEAWWSQKHTFNMLSKVLNIKVDKEKGNKYIGQLLKGQEVRMNNADYRLHTVKEGKLL